MWAIEATQDDGLIADEAGCAIHRMRVAAVGFEVRLGARDEEAAGFVQPMQSPEIEVAAVHHIESTGFESQLIENVDVVKLAVDDVDKCGDIAAQVEQRVHAGIGAQDGKWQMFAYAKNATDELYRVSIIPFAGDEFSVYGPPSTYGLRVAMNF